MNKYVTRVGVSSRGEIFNPLIWPFLLSTLAYGVGFALVYPFTNTGGSSALYTAMASISPIVPTVWGVLCLLTIISGLTFLLFGTPPAGKLSGLVGFMLWLFAGVSFVSHGDFIILFSVAIPNMVFWFWQYINLVRFRREDAEDEDTMISYEHGDYDEV